MILGPILLWLFLPFLVLLLVLIQRNQENRFGLFRSNLVEYSSIDGKDSQLRRLIRLAFQRTFGDPSPFPGRKLSVLESRYAALRIKRIYTRLLNLSLEVDYDFHPCITPEEVMQAIRFLFPEIKQDLVTITAAHARLMFGEMPEKQQDLDVVEKSWLRLQAYAETRWRVRSSNGWRHDEPGCTCS